MMCHFHVTAVSFKLIRFSAVNYESSHNSWPSIFILYLRYFIVVNDSCSKYINLICILQQIISEFISRNLLFNIIVIFNINFFMLIHYNSNFIFLFIYILFNMIFIYYNLLYFFSLYFSQSSFASTSTYAIPINLSERSNFKPISYMTSKVMSAVVKTISSIDQWFPRISWTKPIKSKLTVRPINAYHQDDDDFSSEE